MSWCHEHDCPPSICSEYQHESDVFRCYICGAMVRRKDIPLHRKWHEDQEKGKQ